MMLLASTALTCFAHGPAYAAPDEYVLDTGTDTFSSAQTKTKFTVGETGTAVLNVTDGASMTVTGDDIILGNQNGSSGTLNTSGTVTLTTNRFYVGIYGNGAVNATDGTTINLSGANSVLYVGYDIGAVSTFSLAGSSSSIDGYDMRIGWAQTGTGTVTFKEGADATFRDGVVLGNSSVDASGTLNVEGSGSTLTASVFTIGNVGNGTMTISDGGTVTAAEQTSTSVSDKGVVFVARGDASTSSVTVTGDGSELAAVSLYAGENGKATVEILDGGKLTLSDLLEIGRNNTSVSTVTVSGKSSTDTASSVTANRITVGNFGTGTLIIKDGATVSGGGNVSVGLSKDSNGTLTVSGSGSKLALTTGGSLYIGNNGTGNATVSSGGVIEVPDDIYLGYHNPTSDSVSASTGVGTLLVTGAGSSVSATRLEVGRSGTGTLTLADGGAVTVNSGTGTLDIAKSSGSTGTLIIGAAAGSDAVAAGTLNATTVAFGSALTGSETSTGKIVFNITDTDYTFDKTITGAGAVDVAAGTVNLTGTSTYTGATTVNGGTLNIAGSIASVVSINNGAFLTGNGTVGGLTVNSGGTVSPGGSTIKTLTVSGDTTFASGSVYVVQVDDTSSDAISVTGSATIDSTAKVTLSALNGDNSSIAVDKKYTIITTTTGVTGRFASISKYSAYLQDELTYDDDNVYLTRTRNGQALAVQTTTPNEGSTAGAVDSLSNGNSLYDAVVQLPTGETSAAFDQLSGEVHASTASTIVTNSGMSRTAVNNRIRDSFSGGGANSAPLVASNDDNMDGLLGKQKNTQAWMSNFGSWSTTSGDNDAHKTTTHGGGMMVGVDTLVLDDWRFGVATGFGRDSIQDKNVSSSAMVDSYYLAAYGGTEIEATSLRFGALHAFQRIDSKRSVGFSGFTDNLTADYDAATTQVFVEGALRVKHQESRFEPYVNVAFVHSKVDGFQESGGAAALTSSSQSDNQLSSTLGLRLGHDLEIDFLGLSGELKAGLGWRHAYGDMSQDSTVSFAGSNSFTVSSASSARDSAVLEAGVSVGVAQDTTVSLNYNGEFSQDSRDNTLSAKLAMKF
jgi:outer membrane autotransporter protein